MGIAVYILPLIRLLIGIRALAIGARLNAIDQPGHLHKTHAEPTAQLPGINNIFSRYINQCRFCRPASRARDTHGIGWSLDDPTRVERGLRG